jgi:hypothetical protein
MVQCLKFPDMLFSGPLSLEHLALCSERFRVHFHLVRLFAWLHTLDPQN